MLFSVAKETSRTGSSDLCVKIAACLLVSYDEDDI
jgi:hypothetical protein